MLLFPCLETSLLTHVYILIHERKLLQAVIWSPLQLCVCVGREDPSSLDCSRGNCLSQIHHQQRRVEFWRSVVGGDELLPATLRRLGQPDCELIIHMYSLTGGRCTTTKCLKLLNIRLLLQLITVKFCTSLAFSSFLILNKCLQNAATYRGVLF